MIKFLNKNDVLTTPYMATKEWRLSNTDNNDLILFEHTGSNGGELAVAIEFIDYGDGSGDPFNNSSCSLAKEQQTGDRIEYREGKKTSGLFYPEEPQNIDSTYKRLVYAQIKGTFYNNYRDPSKMWGMEEIDFDKSQTKKFLSDKFVLLDVPTDVMGEKILPNSVHIYDDTQDDQYIITDDGHCNLIIGTDVFSKKQELRYFGNHFISGSDNTCNDYFNPPIPLIVSGSAADTGSFGIGVLTGSLNEYPFTDSSSYDIGVSSGSLEASPFSEFTSFDVGILTGSLIDPYIEVYANDSASMNINIVFGSVNQEPLVDSDFSPVNIGVISGDLVTILIPTSGSDSASVDMGFYSGSIENVVLITSGSDSASVDMGFYSGSVETTIMMTSSFESASVDMGFFTGSVTTIIVPNSQIEYSILNVGLISGTLTG